MKIEKLKLGFLETNCYLLKKGNEVVIIDPADSADIIINACQGYRVVGILVTHHHPDHIGALEALEYHYKIKHNKFDVINYSFEVIETPGHTNDSISFYFSKDKVLFSGDFIFEGTIGRFDFPNSSLSQMRDSLEKISKYPDDIIVYPGHGNSTILGKEKRTFKYYF